MRKEIILSGIVVFLVAQCSILSVGADPAYSDFKTEIVSNIIDTEVVVNITNIGENTRTDVPWRIHFSRFPFLNGKWNYFVIEGKIEVINPDETVTVSSGDLFGFRLRTYVMVYTDNYGATFEWCRLIGPYCIRSLLNIDN